MKATDIRENRKGAHFRRRRRTVDPGLGERGNSTQLTHAHLGRASSSGAPPSHSVLVTITPEDLRTYVSADEAVAAVRMCLAQGAAPRRRTSAAKMGNVSKWHLKVSERYSASERTLAV